MKIYIFVMSLILVCSANIKAQDNTGNTQSSLEKTLAEISKNNKTILANVQYWEVKKLEYKTGLTPYNPKVDYDYLSGSPAGAGNQTDFVITQAFDFPTSYAKKKKLSNEQIKQAEFQLNASRQDVLLEAKLICIELIYFNKFQDEVLKRKQNTEKWLSDFQAKLDKGDGNMLDVNKAKLQLIEINASFQENKSMIIQLNQKLTELNGGNLIVFADSGYPQLPLMTSFETLESEIETNDPVKKYLEQQNVIGRSQLDVSKAMTLPKLDVGYHYQAILGQSYNGVHVGFTLPLWENRNKVKAEQANTVFNELNLSVHKNEHYYDTQQKYIKQSNLSITVTEYSNLFNSSNNVDLLNKSLALGQISTIQYFMEMSYYYEALKNYLVSEKEYHKTIAELYKYQL